MSSTFDRCLETRQIMTAAEEYALRRGPAKSPAYRAAWLEFRRRVRTVDDLREHAPEVVNPDVLRVLDAAIERAMLIDGASMANAQLLDPSGRALRIVAHTGFGAEFLQFFQTVDNTSCACGRALATGRAVWVPDTMRSPIFADTPALDVMLNARIRAVASIPVRYPNGEPIGMISTHHAQSTRWTDQRKLALRAVARSAGHLLDHLTPAAPENQPGG